MKLVEFLRTRGQTRPEGCPGRLPAEPRVGFEAGRDGPDSGAPEGRTPPSGSLGMRARGCGRLDTRSSRFETLPPEVLARNNLHRTRKRCGVTSAQSADGSSRQEPRADRGKGEHNRTRQRRDRLLTLSSPHLAILSPRVGRIEFGQCIGRRTLWRRDRQIDPQETDTETMRLVDLCHRNALVNREETTSDATS
jgi:hypothetical protein